MANRAGPLAQLVWDLAMNPSFRVDYIKDPERHLAELGFEATRLSDVRKAIAGDHRLLIQMLNAEDKVMDKIYGKRPSNDHVLITTGWPFPKYQKPPDSKKVSTSESEPKE